MKILEVGMSSHIGGVETYFHNYYYKFSPEFHFDFIALNGEMCFSDEYQKNGSKVFSVPNFKRNPISYYFKLKKILKDGNFDAIHVNMLSLANVLPVIAGHFSKTKVIVHSHNSGTPAGLARKILHKVNKPFLFLADERFACSELAGKWMFGSKSFKIIPNAMAVSEFAFNEAVRNDVRREYGIEDSFVVGHVGRYQEQKNHRYIVKIFNEYHKLSPDSKLMLVGGGELFDGIHRELKSLGLLDDVIFIEKSSEVEKLYQAMDVFILPSLFEGLSLVAVEAQLAGLPCVFSDTLTRETKMSDNVSFVSIEDNDVDKWCTEIDKYSKASIVRTENIKAEKYDIVLAVKIFEKCLREK